MKKISIQDLKRHLSRFIDLASEGESIVISRHHRPVARLGPALEEGVRRGRRAGEADLEPLLERATGGRFLSVLAEDRGTEEDA